MSDTCSVEVGLLKKHPCGTTAVTRCVNCEQPLCSKHAVSKMSAGKKVFLCHECARAWKESEKLGDVPPVSSAAPAAPAPAAKKPPEPPKPAPVAKPAAPEKKPEPAIEHSGALEFTPGKPSAPPQKQPEPAPAAKKPEPPPPTPGKFELSIEQSSPPEDKKK